MAWFPDGDGDGFGRSSGKVRACTPPTNGAWVNVGRDCDDDNKLVYPMAPTSSDKGYVLAAAAGIIRPTVRSGLEETDTGQLVEAARLRGAEHGEWVSRHWPHGLERRSAVRQQSARQMWCRDADVYRAAGRSAGFRGDPLSLAVTEKSDHLVVCAASADDGFRPRDAQ